MRREKLQREGSFFFFLFKTCAGGSSRREGIYISVQFNPSVMSDSATPCIAAGQASLSITNSWILFKLMSIKLVIPSNHLILCSPFSCLQSFPASRSFPMCQFFTSVLWPKYCGFGFRISPSNEYSGLISFRIDWLGLLYSLLILCTAQTNTIL